MITNIDGTERLYLSKGDQIIYIDNCKIAQHHIDGIRFLFRLYRKKKSGVIINDTSGYGRNLQIVLFLKAVRQLLTQPVLVLCLEGAEHDWMEQFQTWTDLCEDVVLENQKPFIKKLVFINTMSNLSAFCRRDWGVVVMDGDKASQQVLGLPFKADFKIWVTPDNMRENLDKFSKIYKWFYPKGKFDKSEFTPDKSNLSDVIEKSIRLDAFMEDIVARSEEAESSKHLENNQKDNSPPFRVSRKNKDATGTKIKRSKRKIYDDEDDVPLSKTKKDPVKVSTQSTVRKSTTKINHDYSTDDYSSIDNFKKKSLEELKKHLLNIATPGEPNTDIKFNTSNSPNDIKLFYEPDPADDNSDTLYEMDTQIFASDTSDNYTTDMNYILKDFAGSKRNNSVRDDMSDLELETANNIPNKISRKMKVISQKAVNKESLNEILDVTEDEDSERGSPSIFQIKSDENEDENTKENSFTESLPNRNEIKSAINELITFKKSSQSDEIKTDINEINLENDVKDKTCENSLTLTNYDELIPDIKHDDKNIQNEVQKKSEINEHIDDKKPVTNDVAVTNSLKQSKMDDKMKKLEEKALKKFKGSILDSLF